MTRIAARKRIGFSVLSMAICLPASAPIFAQNVSAEAAFTGASEPAQEQEQMPLQTAQTAPPSFGDVFGDMPPAAPRVQPDPDAVDLDSFKPKRELPPPPKPEAKPKTTASSGRVIRSLGMKTASFYGKRFHGRLTANGERFNMNAMTAAHKTLPFGTKVRVTYPRNGRSIVVRINDRGPFIKGRAIDLSRGAAAKLGFINSGHARVKLDIMR